MAVFVEVEVEEVRRETDAAFMFVIDGEDVWVPKSQVRESDGVAVYKGQTNVKVEITKWIADERGISYESERRY